MPDNGTDVDFENDLGFDASASQQIQKDIEWDGEIYPIDTVVSAGLDMTIYKLSYTWSFIRRERGFVGDAKKCVNCSIEN